MFGKKWKRCQQDAFSLLHPPDSFAIERLTVGLARRMDAGVAKLVDAPDLGSGAARRGGSSPSTRTKFDKITYFFSNFLAFFSVTILSNLANYA